MKSRTIKVDYLARVEGEGGMFIRIKDKQVKDIQLRIFEPPRFFEAFLRGRHFTEAPDITARICGICPIAYLLGASYAMEDACGVTVDGPIRDLRKLVYFGEWIESHVLHLAMLHAPDFLGYQDAIQMAKDYPDVVKNALRLKKIGNEIMVVLGGREVHPINLKVGGFYKVPRKRDVRAMLDDLKWGLDAAIGTAKLVATFPFPELNIDYEFIALRHPNEYGIIEGNLVSNRGMDIPIRQYDDHLVESHVKHSTSLHTHVRGRDTAHVGPVARYNLNYDQLSPAAKATAEEIGLERDCRNPFRSIVVRAIEVIHSYEESINIIERYEEPDQPAVTVEPRPGTGYGCTEAPRGICYHRYTIDDKGIIQDAKIVSPTAVNQPTIEKDLWQYVTPNVELPDEKLQWVCEQAIRNYDPCISCSCHFLNLKVDRE